MTACGCTDDNACVDELGPCWWVDIDLCSRCAGILEDQEIDA